MAKEYDPSIQGLLDQCESDWGAPEMNRTMLLPYGIPQLDRATYGMDAINGELVVIQGPEKQRKTTLTANIICNYMTSPLPKEKPFTDIDSLESGMNAKRYRDALISIMATRYLFAAGHVHNGPCLACGGGRCREIGISPEFLRYNTRTAAQKDAISAALAAMYVWPLHIYGANPLEGNTRSLNSSVTGASGGISRWEYLIKEYDAKVFVTDHVQQYTFDNFQTDYEKQLRAIAAISDMVAKYNIVCLLLSQVSLTSQREVGAGTGKYIASGGSKAAQEATVILSVNYEPGSGQIKVTLEDSRKASRMALIQPIEDVSGNMYGDAIAGSGRKNATFETSTER